MNESFPFLVRHPAVPWNPWSSAPFPGSARVPPPPPGHLPPPAPYENTIEDNGDRSLVNLPRKSRKSVGREGTDDEIRTTLDSLLPHPPVSPWLLTLAKIRLGTYTFWI